MKCISCGSNTNSSWLIFGMGTVGICVDCELAYSELGKGHITSYYTEKSIAAKRIEDSKKEKQD